MAEDDRFKPPTVTIDYDRIVNEVVARIRIPDTPLPEKRQHFVLVAEESADYWPRLSSDLIRAQEAYKTITLVGKPPFDAGVMPQLVLYENGTPLHVYRGVYEVSTALSLLIRGEFEFKKGT